jgi:hypothetical protein
MTARPSPICRDARRELIAALLDAPGRGDLPNRLAEHVRSCRDCAAYRDHLLAATRLLPPEGGYHPRLRARTLAAVARDREHSWPGLWLWLPPAAAVCGVAAYGLPAWALANAFETALGSTGLGLAAALPVVGSLLVLLPATLALALLRRARGLNGVQPFEEKGVPR